MYNCLQAYIVTNQLLHASTQSQIFFHDYFNQRNDPMQCITAYQRYKTLIDHTSKVCCIKPCSTAFADILPMFGEIH